MFYMVVRGHKLGEVENECTLHNSIVLAIFVPKLWKLMEIWPSSNKNNFDCFFETRCICDVVQLFLLVLTNEETLQYVRRVCAADTSPLLAANYFNKFDNYLQFYLTTMATMVSR